MLFVSTFSFSHSLSLSLNIDTCFHFRLFSLSCFTSVLPFTFLSLSLTRTPDPSFPASLSSIPPLPHTHVATPPNKRQTHLEEKLLASLHRYDVATKLPATSTPPETQRAPLRVPDCGCCSRFASCPRPLSLSPAPSPLSLLSHSSPAAFAPPFVSSAPVLSTLR